MKNEKFSSGETVYLIHAKHTAKITRLLNSNLVYVEIDGDEIPIFISDITKEIPVQQNTSEEKKKIDSAGKNKINLTNTGIFIAFEPLSNNDENIHSFNVYIINDTSSAIDFSYVFFSGNERQFSFSKPIIPADFILLHTIAYDLLNEMPSFELRVREVRNEFNGILKQKIKPQNFFNKLSVAPLLEKESYIYRITTETAKLKTEIQKSQSITIDHEVLKMMMMSEEPVNKDRIIGGAVEEIDLHIEKLIKDYTGMSNGEIMQLQLSKFQQALERSVAHHSFRLYVIHGIGKGRLKDEIHNILKSYRYVKSFNNNYHPRYGYGATEVILR